MDSTADQTLTTAEESNDALNQHVESILISEQNTAPAWLKQKKTNTGK